MPREPHGAVQVDNLGSKSGEASYHRAHASFPRLLLSEGQKRGSSGDTDNELLKIVDRYGQVTTEDNMGYILSVTRHILIEL